MTGYGCSHPRPRRVMTTLSLPLLLWILTLVLALAPKTQALLGTEAPAPDSNYANANDTLSSCPEQCSCLGSYVECKKEPAAGRLPSVPSWTSRLVVTGPALLGDDCACSLDGLDGLEDLTLEGNSFTSVPRLGALPSLRRLSLADCAISEIRRDDLVSLPALEELDLAGNAISALGGDAVPVSATLRRLRLSAVGLSTVGEEAFDGLPALRRLDLERNALSTLPKFLFKNLTALERLDLNGNRIDVLEGLVFRGLVSLTALRLRRNRIRAVNDAAFYGLSAIESLRLDGNSIRTIGKGWIYGLGTLRRLTLAGNAIDNVEPGCWEPAESLRELDLSENRLTAVRADTFEHLRELRTLRLDRNEISTIAEGAFRHLTELRTLRLDGNRISWTIEDANAPFAALGRLVELGLADNRVKSIGERAFVGLGSLATLDLSENNVTSLQEKAFAPLAALKKLRLNTAALVCDCSLRWAGAWLRTLAVDDDLSVACAYPAEHRGTSLLDLAEKNLTCDRSPKPKIVEHPKTQLAIRGEIATLRCSASAPTGDLHFLWRKNDQNFTRGNSQQFASAGEDGVTKHSSVLLIPAVGGSHSGKYQCVASNGYGSTYSRKARVTIVAIPKFEKKPTNMTVKVGETAKLECAAVGDPAPQIAWQKDGGNNFPAARERRMHVMPSDDVFFIVDTKLTDAGVYSCTAQNAAGKVISNATLTVLEPPSFVSEMENKEVTAGDDAVLECMVSGSPKPSLAWFKDGVPLRDAGDRRHFFTAENQLLVIVDTRPVDAGKYECEIANSLGKVRDSTELRVLPPTSTVVNREDMKGIIIITVVCCAVVTSVVWVGIIYHTRKRSNRSGPAQSEALRMTPISTAEMQTAPTFTDDASEHSSCKDSGTGDSAKRSSAEALNADEYLPPYCSMSRVISREEEDSLIRQQRPYFCASTSLDFEAATGDSIPYGAGMPSVDPQVQQWFAAVDKDRSGHISAQELQAALVNAQGKNFSDTACRLMIAMFDSDRSGTINVDEFGKLYAYINQWLGVFHNFDKDQSGHIEENELSQALTQMGFRFTPEFIKFLLSKSENKSEISVDQFIVVCVQIQRFTEAFRSRDTQQQGVITIGFEDFLSVALSISI